MRAASASCCCWQTYFHFKRCEKLIRAAAKITCSQSQASRIRNCKFIISALTGGEREKGGERESVCVVKKAKGARTGDST